MKTFSAQEVVADIEATFGVTMQLDSKKIDEQLRFMTLFSTSEFAQEFSMAKNPRDATQAMTRFFQETRFPYTEILPSLEDTFSIYIQAMGKMVYELVATSNDSNALIDKLKTLKKEYIGAEFCVVNPHTKTSVFVKN